MKTRKNNIWLVLFDTLFVMLLCFATLLTAMLLKGEAGTGMSYLLDYPTLGITAGALALYFAYLLPLSNRGLKVTISAIYDNNDTE